MTHDTQRVRYEAWCREQGYPYFWRGAYGDTHYCGRAWKAWQAAQASAAEPPDSHVPVQGKEQS